MGLSNRSSQAIFPFRNDHQVNVIVHECVGRKMKTMNSTVVLEQLQIIQAIVNARKYPHGTDSSLRDMVWNSGNDDTSHSGHGASF